MISDKRLMQMYLRNDLGTFIGQTQKILQPHKPYMGA